MDLWGFRERVSERVGEWDAKKERRGRDLGGVSTCEVDGDGSAYGLAVQELGDGR